jgi:hypothetical protein
MCVSDRNLKTNIEPVDPQAILESVARLPVSTWSYKSDPATVRHMGPMAQDFKASFGLGDTDKAYHPIDAHGVELAAIQALYERLDAQSARLEKLERDNERLQSQCAPRDASSLRSGKPMTRPRVSFATARRCYEGMMTQIPGCCEHEPFTQ